MTHNPHVEEIYGERTTFLSVTAFLIMGLLLIWAGTNYLNTFWHFMTVDPNTYQITKLILSCFVVVFAWNSFSKFLITEGIVVLYIGISSAVFSIGMMLFGIEGLNKLDALFSIGIMIAAVLIFRRNKFVSLSAMILGCTMSVPYVFGYHGDSILMGLGLLFSGVLFMYYALGNLLYGETGKNIFHITQNDVGTSVSMNSKQAYVIIVIPCMITFSLLQILVGTQFLIVDDASLSYCVAEAFMSLAIIIFSVYGMFRGIVAESLMMFMFAISCFVFAFVALSGFEPTPVVDFIMSIVLLSIGIVFVMREDFLLGTGALIFATGGFMESAFMLYQIGEWMIIAAGLISLYYPIHRWIMFETEKTFKMHLKDYLDHING